MSFQEEKGDKKLQDYKKRLREIEIENEQLGTRLVKARHHIKRLRIERIVLLEEIDELRQIRSSRSKKSNGLFGLSGGVESDSEMSVSESVLSDVKNSGAKRNVATAPRKKRDPNAPKGPGNVFFLYCRMERDNIKDEVPNESLGEVTRLLGQKWKSLTKEEKQKYYDIYKKEQEEYESAMKSYTAAGGGLEGAAAVEANKSTKQDDEDEEGLDESEEEEIDMLQDEEEEEDEEEDEEDATGEFGQDKLEPTRSNAIASLINNQFLDLSQALVPQLIRARYTKEFYLEQVHKPRYIPTPAIFFGHPLLEPLTKTAWYIVPTVWLPYVGYQLHQSLAYGYSRGTGMSFGLGIIIWTLLEYLLHRFFFHLDDMLPDHQAAFVLHFVIHGFHHYLPMDRLRLVMPPTLAIMIAYPLVSLGHFLFPPMMAHGVIAGGFFGYILYDCTHYYLHHAKVFKYHFTEMKKYHMAHHYKNYEGGYGITSKIWDYCFGTKLEYVN